MLAALNRPTLAGWPCFRALLRVARTASEDPQSGQPQSEHLGWERTPRVKGVCQGAQEAPWAAGEVSRAVGGARLGRSSSSVTSKHFPHGPLDSQPSNLRATLN